MPEQLAAEWLHPVTGKADDPLAQWHIGKDFIGKQGCRFGHTAGATAGAKPPLLAGKARGRPGQALKVAVIAAHAQEAVFEATALEVGLEFSVNMVGQGFALLGQLVDQRRVVRFDELIEKCLLGLMPTCWPTWPRWTTTA